MAKYKVTLGIGLAAANHEDIIEVNDTELAACKTEFELNALLESYWQDWANNYIDGNIVACEEE